MASQGPDQDHVVVLDCGGGTVDWAFLRKGTDGFVVDDQFPPGGNDKLGGRNIDDEILEHVTECLENQEDQKALTTLNKLKSWFRNQIREMKELFNETGSEETLSVDKHKISLAKGRATAEKRFVQQVLVHIKTFVEPIREDLGENPPILLVGGSANLKGIREQVEQATQCKVVNWDRCDWAPVLGAVSYGQASRRPSETTTSDSTPGSGNTEEPEPAFSQDQLVYRRSQLTKLFMAKIYGLAKKHQVELSRRLNKHDLVKAVSEEKAISTHEIDLLVNTPPDPSPPQEDDSEEEPPLTTPGQYIPWAGVAFVIFVIVKSCSE